MTQHCEILTQVFQSQVTLDVEDRLNTLSRLESMLKAHRDILVQSVFKDLGRPTIETFLSEIYFTIQEIRHAKRYLRKWSMPKQVKGPLFNWPSKNIVASKPKGVVLIIAPWNYPIQLTLSPAIAALGAGNVVFIKPSEHAPHTSECLKEISLACGLGGRIQWVMGGPDQVDQLLEMKWDHVFFTGSEKIGRKVYEKAAQSLTPVTLELGGRNPCVVDSTAKIEQTVNRVCHGKFFNAGQTCVAPNVLIVPDHLQELYIDKLKATILAWYGKDPALSPDFGRIVNEIHVERIEKLIPEHAIQFGKIDRKAHFVPPMIIPDTKWSDSWIQDEIFGPILPVIPYKKEEDLNAELPKYRHALACYVFSRNDHFINRVESLVRPATMGINDTMKQITTNTMPLGGRGHSGIGRYRGYHGFETFSHFQSISKRYFNRWDLFSLFPPYGKKGEKLLKWLS
ncbi:MAG: aldehyde dehydrogenase family protein [Bdellovibrionales bacterium]|nr:aldehyde dehydrogenase family protein [Bdellovibrionales bacterium]